MSKHTAHWPKVDPRRGHDAAFNKKVSMFLSALALRRTNKDFPLPEDPYEHLKNRNT